MSLDGAPNDRVVIDLDKPSSPLSGEETRCDYLVFAEERGAVAWFAPMELKKGGLRPSKVVPQLQAGADAAAKVVGVATGSSTKRSGPESPPVNFLPVAAVGGRIHRADRTELRKKAMQVQFGHRKARVQVTRCGGSLVDTLRRAGQMQ